MSGTAARWLSRVFATVAAGSLICAVGFDIWARSRPSVEKNAGFIADVDHTIDQLPDTDIVVRLIDVPPNANDKMLNLYYRGNFTAYPRRVFMNDPQVPMDYLHDQPTAFNFDPSVPWMLAHHVGGEITLDRAHAFVPVVERILPSGRQPQ